MPQKVKKKIIYCRVSKLLDPSLHNTGISHAFSPSFPSPQRYPPLISFTLSCLFFPVLPFRLPHLRFPILFPSSSPSRTPFLSLPFFLFLLIPLPPYPSPYASLFFSLLTPLPIPPYSSPSINLPLPPSSLPPYTPTRGSCIYVARDAPIPRT